MSRRVANTNFSCKLGDVIRMTHRASSGTFWDSDTWVCCVCVKGVTAGSSLVNITIITTRSCG